MLYVLVATLFIKDSNIYELWRVQSDSESDQAVTGVTHLDRRMQYGTDNEDAKLLVQAADFLLGENKI